MGIDAAVKKVISIFETENPKLKGKAYLTSGNRTWEEQLDIILEPKRVQNYLNIKNRFLKEAALQELPKSRKALDPQHLKWWQKEIMKQAGKGFAHVGGKAQDVSVKLLSPADKKQLLELMTKGGVKVLMEQVTGTKSVYGVSISQANVFHCTQ